MRLLDPLHIEVWVPVIEMIGGLIIAGYALAAIFALLHGSGISRARLLVAEGSLMGLSFKLAATLLKTIIIHTWTEILIFASILALRTVLKWVFQSEQARVERTMARTRKVVQSV